MTLNIHQKIVLTFSFVTFVLLMYEDLLHLLGEFFHVLFESVEHLLDIVIEHFLETGTHETQVIVFYTLIPLIFFSVYYFLPRWYRIIKRNLCQQKNVTLAQWHVLPLRVKFEWWLFFIAFFSCWLFFSF